MNDWLPQTLGLVSVIAVIAFWVLPIMFLVDFAKRERKDWRVALACGLIFSWLVALVIVLVIPKLSDEEFDRINPPKEKRNKIKLFGNREKAVAVKNDVVIDPTKILLSGLGLGFCILGGFIAWLSWGI